MFMIFRCYTVLTLLFFTNLLTTTLCSENYLYLTDRSYGAGMFSVFNSVIGCLDYYENSKAPGMVVNFEKNGTYYDSSRGQNWWEYYFEPINVGKKNDGNIKRIAEREMCEFSLYAQHHMSRYRANELIQRYVRLKPHITKQIDSYVSHNFKKSYVIGVHYRATDNRIDTILVPYDDMYDYIKTAIDKAPRSNIKVFIATDDAHFLNFINNKLSKYVIARESTIRSFTAQGVHLSNVGTPYKRGEDALIDCVLLSKCDILLKTESNLSDSSLMFNPRMPMVYLTKR